MRKICSWGKSSNQILTFSVSFFYLTIIDSANKGATAQHLYDELKKKFDSAGIPTENVSLFASDGCNTIFSGDNSVDQRMKESYNPQDLHFLNVYVTLYIYVPVKYVFKIVLKA